MIFLGEKKLIQKVELKLEGIRISQWKWIFLPFKIGKFDNKYIPFLPQDEMCLSSIIQSLHLSLPFPSACLRHVSLFFGLLYILSHPALFLPLLSFITLPLWFLFSNSKLIDHWETPDAQLLISHINDNDLAINPEVPVYLKTKINPGNWVCEKSGFINQWMMDNASNDWSSPVLY